MPRGLDRPHIAAIILSSMESLLDILKRRYALGEITTAQFKEMKRTLNLSETTETAAEHGHH